MSSILDINIPEQREILRRLFRVKKTEGEMLTTRGYTLNEVYLMKDGLTFDRKDLSILQQPNLPLAQLQQEFGFTSRQYFSSLYYNPNNPQDKIFVIYLTNEPGKLVNDKDFQIVKTIVESQYSRRLILITQTGLGLAPDNYIRNEAIGYKIEVFLDQDLAFNTTKHALSPIYIKHIPANQVEQWCQEEEIPSNKLPLIMTADKLAKWYGAEPLDGFQYKIMGTTTDDAGYYRITRMTPTVGKEKK